VTLDEERAGFGRALEAQLRAPATVRVYLGAIDGFGRFLDEKKIRDLRAVTPTVVNAYAEALGGCGLAVQTQRLMLRGLKRFFEHLVATGRLLASPAEHLGDRRAPRREIQPLAAKELAQLREAIDVAGPMGMRDRAMVELLRCAGLRAGELCGLAVYDLDLDGGQVRVRARQRERIAPLDADAQRWLRKYVREIRPLHARAEPDERRLFVTRAGKPLTVGALQQVMLRWGRLAKVAVSCAALRRTAAARQEMA
jgi:integrase/recombinase XerD